MPRNASAKFRGVSIPRVKTLRSQFGAREETLAREIAARKCFVKRREAALVLFEQRAQEDRRIARARAGQFSPNPLGFRASGNLNPFRRNRKRRGITRERVGVAGDQVSESDSRYERRRSIGVH